LKQINKGNVKELVPVWIFPYGVVDGQQGCPIVHQGIMWQTSSWNHVFCLDARTGAPIWRYDHPLEEDVAAHI
jgi:alcohol dehydrogenase (cytochrome c)